VAEAIQKDRPRSREHKAPKRQSIRGSTYSELPRKDTLADSDRACDISQHWDRSGPPRSTNFPRRGLPRHKTTMNLRSIRLLALSAGALALLLTACTYSASNAPIRLGVITSLTGTNAPFGQAHKAGYTIAVNDINAGGGLNGRRLEIVYFDDQSKPDRAVQGVTKLVDQEHVPLLLGAYSSESTLAMVPVVTQKRVPLIIPTAVADNIMAAGSPWVFRICAGSGTFAAATLDFLKSNGDPQNIALIYENTNFGQSNRKSMLEAAQWRGLNVIADEAYQAKSPDYEELLRRVKKRNPEVIYFASYLFDATALMREAKQLDLNPKYYTSAATGFAAPEFPSNGGAGDQAEYTFSVSQWLPSVLWKGAKEFDAKYFQLLNVHPAYHGMEAYAAVIVAKEAIAKAGSLDPTALRDVLRQIDIPETPFGPVKFDAHGQNTHPVLVTQVLRKEGKLDHRVVWPPQEAETRAVIPTPTWAGRSTK
jgi:branched-chain amino acid transport system substrate-binding protein